MNVDLGVRYGCQFHICALGTEYSPGLESRFYQHKLREGKATLPKEENLVKTPVPLDHSSSASMDEAALPERKRSFAEAMGADKGFAGQTSSSCCLGFPTWTSRPVLSTRRLSAVLVANTYSIFGSDLRSNSSPKPAT